MTDQLQRPVLIYTRDARRVRWLLKVGGPGLPEIQVAIRRFTQPAPGGWIV